MFDDNQIKGVGAGQYGSVTLIGAYAIGLAQKYQRHHGNFNRLDFPPVLIKKDRRSRLGRRKKIPIRLKIKNSDDLMRKHIVRDLALEVGVPEMSAFKRKKALQYGSLIHKTLMKTK